MKRSGLFLLTLALGLAAWLVLAGGARALTPDVWRVVGSPDERWTIEENQVMAYSEHHFVKSFLVTDFAKIPPLTDLWFEFQLTPLQGTDHNFVWNFQDVNNYYQAHFNGGAIWVSRFKFGQEVLSQARSFTTTNGQTYDVVITQVGSHIELIINGQEIIIFDDGTNNVDSSGAVGFKLSPGAVTPVETRFENIVIRDPLVTTLPIQRFKQTDTAWGSLEYDTGHLWSTQPTISRWGCALTSLVMIMRSYGLADMPDSQPVNPETVNEWLVDQPDGYVGQGLVNWFAAMRLVREISDEHSTAGTPLPKLEFTYWINGWRAQAEVEINAGRPLMAQVPGHFMVVNGFNARTDEFSITDPFYEYERLSQHPAVQSLRLFRPSQTDLSALVVVHKSTVTVEIKNELGEVVSQSWEEYLSADGAPETTEPWMFTAIFQPSNGEYELSAQGAQEDGDIQIMLYDQLANVTIEIPSASDYTNFDILSIPITFSKETGGEVDSHFSWAEFSAKLVEFHEQSLLTQIQFDRLNTLAQFAATAPENTWPRYKNYLRNILEFYSSAINNEVKIELLAFLE